MANEQFPKQAPPCAEYGSDPNKPDLGPRWDHADQKVPVIPRSYGTADTVHRTDPLHPSLARGDMEIGDAPTRFPTMDRSSRDPRFPAKERGSDGKARRS